MDVKSRVFLKELHQWGHVRAVVVHARVFAPMSSSQCLFFVFVASLHDKGNRVSTAVGQLEFCNKNGAHID